MYTKLFDSDQKGFAEQSLLVKNCGFGPAIIKSFVLIKDNVAYPSMLDIYRKYTETQILEERLTRLMEIKDYVLASNETLYPFAFYFKQSDFDPHALNFHKLAKGVSLKIEYETIYREAKIYTVPSLTE